MGAANTPFCLASAPEPEGLESGLTALLCSCTASVFLTQGRESCPVAHLGARSVMLRIPLPEDDGFTLALLAVARTTPIADFANP